MFRWYARDRYEVELKLIAVGALVVGLVLGIIATLAIVGFVSATRVGP